MELIGNNYKERSESQLKHWVEGNPIHNKIDDECCPDFSCCNPKLLANEEMRKTFYNANDEQRESMLFSFLASGISDMGHEVLGSVHIANGKDEINGLMN